MIIHTCRELDKGRVDIATSEYAHQASTAQDPCVSGTRLENKRSRGRHSWESTCEVLGMNERVSRVTLHPSTLLLRGLYKSPAQQPRNAEERPSRIQASEKIAGICGASDLRDAAFGSARMHFSPRGRPGELAGQPASGLGKLAREKAEGLLGHATALTCPTVHPHGMYAPRESRLCLRLTHRPSSTATREHLFCSSLPFRTAEAPQRSAFTQLARRAGPSETGAPSSDAHYSALTAEHSPFWQKSAFTFAINPCHVLRGASGYPTGRHGLHQVFCWTPMWMPWATKFPERCTLALLTGRREQPPPYPKYPPL
ncbi:hypothetical protein K488DRAFT_74068 [Vararia minispora EC-137]|uniref:Uncharacterized protein n=1 Tax=Vararia minispora EC-137 TaxID=1314806 RepID=A0ACB8Q8C9_9AGAM|nr:hypothetical protein K488DRAFT_74068 [Vararia minispora EC-137]